jgi:hypothetical protein
MAVIRNKAGQFAASWHGGPGRPPGASTVRHEAAAGKVALDFRSSPLLPQIMRLLLSS